MIELNQSSEPEPDLAILKYCDDLYTKSHPKPSDVLLIIEVADTFLEKDRAIKLPLYAAAEIREVWIINLEEQQIEVSTEPGEKGFSNLHIYRKGEIVEHALIGELIVSEVLIFKDYGMSQEGILHNEWLPGYRLSPVPAGLVESLVWSFLHLISPG
ncbi:MAG: hypothetical protein DHS20C18_29280 [Saprospiraceae bacterium]|nr:MAG: hypothetical protein DHS20C18_29280 [Saprospiraceae bacterium]